MKLIKKEGDKKPRKKARKIAANGTIKKYREEIQTARRKQIM